MTRALVGILLCAGAVHADALPSDPAQRVAAKALRGDYGKLPKWQQVGYSAILRGPVRHLTAYRTHYDAGEGRQGRIDRYGNSCTTRTLASCRLPARSWVLLFEKTGAELRQVLDTGSSKNDARFADPNGCSAWVDRWLPHSRLRHVGGPVKAAVTR